VTDAQTFDPDTIAARRARLRRERQARVGILRNPNQPPRPAARRTPLMGKWLNLRSSRRPPAPPPPVPALPAIVVPPRPTVTFADDGGVAGIDVQGLMASVEAVAVQTPARTPYAAEYRPDLPQKALTPQGAAGKPSILTAAAWLDLEDAPMVPPDPGARPAPRPTVLRAGMRALTAVIGGMAVAIVVLLALFGPPG